MKPVAASLCDVQAGTPQSGVATDTARALAAIEAELAGQLSDDQVRRIREGMQAVVDASEAMAEVLDSISAAPGSYAGQVKGMVQIGGGYFRAVMHSIDGLWRARRARR